VKVNVLHIHALDAILRKWLQFPEQSKSPADRFDSPGGENSIRRNINKALAIDRQQSIAADFGQFAWQNLLIVI
jgi:hypothetical protein